MYARLRFRYFVVGDPSLRVVEQSREGGEDAVGGHSWFEFGCFLAKSTEYLIRRSCVLVSKAHLP